MKDCECRIAVEEVMYMLIVAKFYEIKVPMVPNLSKCIKYARLDMSSSQDAELESIHAPEILEMVREHLSNILKWKGKINLMENSSMIHIKRVQLGRIYAASIMYGYFIKSVSLRHQLELSLARTDEDLPLGQLMNSELFKKEQEENLVALGCSFDMASSLHPSYDRRRRVEKLRSYMMGFDSETLQICAKLRSQEAVNLIEKHSYALFEDREKSTQKNDGNIIVTYSAFKRLVLEAVAFGSFLWDVERGLALLIVALLQLLKVPGVAINGALDQIAGVFRGGLEYVLELLRDAIVSLLSSCFELLTSTATGSFQLTTSAITELMEKMKTALDELAEILPEVFEGASEMIGSIVLNLWNSYKDALEYITTNA
ncbi:hypothetical protein COCNU_scaffold002996G000020 [Cocos nucifera]|nr:hypothetical protein [Cocos nucifera]